MNTNSPNYPRQLVEQTLQTQTQCKPATNETKPQTNFVILQTWKKSWRIISSYITANNLHNSAEGRRAGKKWSGRQKLFVSGRIIWTLLKIISGKFGT